MKLTADAAATTEIAANAAKASAEVAATALMVVERPDVALFRIEMSKVSDR